MVVASGATIPGDGIGFLTSLGWNLQQVESHLRSWERNAKVEYYMPDTSHVWCRRVLIPIVRSAITQKDHEEEALANVIEYRGLVQLHLVEAVVLQPLLLTSCSTPLVSVSLGWCAKCVKASWMTGKRQTLSCFWWFSSRVFNGHGCPVQDASDINCRRCVWTHHWMRGSGILARASDAATCLACCKQHQSRRSLVTMRKAFRKAAMNTTLHLCSREGSFHFDKGSAATTVCIAEH